MNGEYGVYVNTQNFSSFSICSLIHVVTTFLKLCEMDNSLKPIIVEYGRTSPIVLSFSFIEQQSTLLLLYRRGKVGKNGAVII